MKKKSKDSKINVLIAGGGTGGHIYPALSFGKAFQKENSQNKIVFVGAPYGLESKLIGEKSEFPLHLIPVKPIHKSLGLKKMISNFLYLPYALLKALFLVIKIKPQVVLGVGGYASGPVVLLAALLGKYTAVWEPNAHLGLANRILSRFVKKVFIVFPEAGEGVPEAKKYFCQYPVRPQIESKAQEIRQLAYNNENLMSSNENLIRVLVFGGSQGAKALCDGILDFCSRLEISSNFHFVVQTGYKQFEHYKDAFQEYDFVEVLPYLDPILDFYAKADLVIGRAGAGTLAELVALSKPSILVPYPFASDNHQKKNALALEKTGGAICIDEKELEERLAPELLDISENPEKLLVMREAAGKAFEAQAVDKMVEEMMRGIGFEVSKK